jgi:hypothetical protein
VFGNVSPLDPQLFYRVNDFADDLLKGERSGKYTPIEVATWLENYSDAATDALGRAERRAKQKGGPEHRRLTIDIAIAAGLGRFFAAKLRAGVLYRIFEQTGDRAALDAALQSYRVARDVWAGIATRTTDVYAADITVGETRVLRGQWADRLADIDTDIAAVAATQESAKPAQSGGASTRAIAEALARPLRGSVTVRHTPPPAYQPGQPLPVELSAEKQYEAVRLHYRQVNQAERWQNVAMQSDGRLWRGAIPAAYTGAAYPLQYYFEVKDTTGSSGLHPGLGEKLTGQPYVIVRRLRA